MHEGEVVATADLVRRLVDAQCPQWRDRPLTDVDAFGTDHVLFRLGDDLVVRMPRMDWAGEQAVSDARWLPVLAPRLPVDVPVPVALGEPAEGFPWPWSVAPWLPGRVPTAYAESLDLVDDLAALVTSFREIDTDGGPVAVDGARGVPLADLDDAVRMAIVACGDRIDARVVTAIWDDALAAPAWPGPPSWLHGDLMPGNLLVDDAGALSAVIDFGCLAVGDPAADLVPAWTVLPASQRARFRAAVEADDDTWRRGRGWALAPALVGIPYYWESVPAFARRGLRTIEMLAG